MKNLLAAHGSVLLIAVVVLAALIVLRPFAGSDKKVVTSVETMTLTLRGMRGGTVYEITDETGKTELRRYREIYKGEETTLEFEKSVLCDSEAFIELMNTCGVMRWDGFHGKHPKNVQDGVMFSFTATVNGGETISADGSAKFPKGYHEFVSELDSMLAK